MGFGIISPISLNPFGSGARTTMLASDWRDRIDKRNQLRQIMAIGCCDLGRQGDAVGVSDDMMLRAFFAAIRRVGSGVCPPKTARTEAESTIARDQSILSASRRWLSNSRCNFSQTPARCQSRRRRQQVMPLPHPISWGRYSQGMPVWRTKRMPVRASRLPIGFRPGNRKRRGLGLGKIGSIRVHSESSRICLAMRVPPCTSMAFIDQKTPFC